MNTQTETKIDPVDYVNNLGLSFEFNPMTSRPDKLDEWSKDAYHFHIRIMNKAGTWAGFYSMGSGHKVLLTKKQMGKLGISTFAPLFEKDYNRIAKAGPMFRPKTVHDKFMYDSMYTAPTPKLVDVLYSLVMDSYAIECGTFEQWADEFGYETDSRKAERIYRACVETGLTLRRMFGDAGLQQLREVFQDY